MIQLEPKITCVERETKKILKKKNAFTKRTIKARFHYERGKEHSFSLLLIFD